jgi:hypothetical protein
MEENVEAIILRDTGSLKPVYRNNLDSFLASGTFLHQLTTAGVCIYEDDELDCQHFTMMQYGCRATCDSYTWTSGRGDANIWRERQKITQPL